MLLFLSEGCGPHLLKVISQTSNFSSNWIYIVLDKRVGLVGRCEGVVYLTSPGRPTDIGLELGKACYPCSR